MKVMNMVKPIIVISKCLTFDACRYNGQMIPDPYIEKMKSFVDFLPVCPEVSIHLGVPRKPIRLVLADEKFQLVQPATGKDCTLDMEQFSHKWLSSLQEVDGFLLKSRSPSCGIKDVRVYPAIDSKASIKKDIGFFVQKVNQLYPHLAQEDEGRILNANIREHFLSQIFLQARFRDLIKQYSISRLIDFHTKNKYLFMAYNQSELSKMGRLVARAKRMPQDQVVQEYQNHIQAMFCKLPRIATMINALLHCFGYVSDKLSSDERSYFLDLIQQYKGKLIPLSVLVSVMKSWIIRFKEPYLSDQTLFNPYPEALANMSDSGKNE
jgi:uncharacterized protein YbgA (DUF1722 family)/uncharacterized protein YbbK (DUF523 family)